MKALQPCATVFLAVCLWAAAGCERVEGPAPPSAPAQEPAALAPVPRTPVIPDTDLGDVWFRFERGDAGYFRLARESLLQDRLSEAAGDLRRGAALLDLQSVRAEGFDRFALKDFARETRAMAVDMEKGKKVPLRFFDRLFADVHQSLSAFHQRKAEEELARGRFRAAGFDMLAALDSLERTLFWSRQKLEPETVATLDEARAEADRLCEGRQAAAGTARDLLRRVGMEIARLSRRIDMENAWRLFQEEAERCFQKARVRFNAQAFPEAAADIRMGAACLALESIEAAGEQREALRREAGRLDDLAARVGSRQVGSGKALEEAFVRAQYVLAASQLEIAARAWSAGDIVKAGDALKAACGSLERGFGWARGAPPKHAVAALKRARAVAGRLAQGDEVGAKEVEGALSQFGKAVENLQWLVRE